ncbi:hypothetical protein LMIY3S_03676 [Labrys miyagiensis]
MSDTPFPHPITFKFGKSRTIIIRTVRNALNFLENHWPEVGGDLYVAARQYCLEALVDCRRAAAARHAFVDALGEAGLETAFEFGFMAATAFGRNQDTVR